MEFLNHLTQKTSNRIAGNGMSIEEFDGQLLTTSEIEAQRAACKLLVQYFAGTMSNDQFEQLYGNTVKSITCHEPEGPDVKQETMICPCKIITGKVHSTCPICRGKGEVQGAIIGGG